MRIEGIIWFDEIIEKLEWKHNVQPREVAEVLANTCKFRFVEKGYRAGENVYAAMGQTYIGRYLIVFFIYKKDKRAFILSARNMTMYTKERDKREVFTLAGEGAILQTWVTIEEVLPDSAAARTNLTKGMTIARINDTGIDNTTDFIAFLNTTVPGQTVEIFFAGNNSTMVELGSLPDRSCGYLGVASTTRIEFAGMTIGEYPASARLHIFKNIPGLMHRIEGWLFIFAMPLIELEGGRFGGFDNSMQFYEPVGWAAGYGALVFWIASALLWIGWINFYAGLFNCLPALPMDGGHVFKDVIHSLFGRVISDHNAEQLSKSIAVAFAVLILVSFVFMIFGPSIVHGF